MTCWDRRPNKGNSCCFVSGIERHAAKSHVLPEVPRWPLAIANYVTKPVPLDTRLFWLCFETICLCKRPEMAPNSPPCTTHPCIGMTVGCHHTRLHFVFRLDLLYSSRGLGIPMSLQEWSSNPHLSASNFWDAGVKKGHVPCTPD